MRYTALLSLILLSCLSTYSQVEKQLVPSDIRHRTIVTEPVTLPKGYFRSGLILSYSVIDKYFDSKARKRYMTESSWGSSWFYLLSFEYGVSNRFMIDLSVPVMFQRHEYDSKIVVPEANSDVSLNTSLQGKGLGDGYITFKYQLVPESETSVSLTAAIDITIPSGRKNPTDIVSFTEYNLPTGNGYFAAGTTLRARKIQYPYSWSAHAGYEYRFSGSRLINATDASETEFRDGNTLQAGGSFNFHLNEWIALANELSIYHRGKGEIRYATVKTIDPTWAFAYETRLVFQIKQFRMGEAIRVPLKGKDCPADPQYVMLVQYIF
ncbi:MAG: transporter [Bacteroidales bacterium]|jgi:hypothetical protein|nr:transporter [Bacteroidales bacterium]